MLSDGVHMVLRVLFDAIADAGREQETKVQLFSWAVSEVLGFDDVP